MKSSGNRNSKFEIRQRKFLTNKTILVMFFKIGDEGKWKILEAEACLIIMKIIKI